LTTYSTRRNSEGLVDFIHEPEHDYRRRLAKASSHRILSHLGSESISDIHFFFVSDIFISEMTIYNPCDFSAINNYPRAISEKRHRKIT
jgi:hypothetical protein